MKKIIAGFVINLIASEAKLLGKIITPERPANMAWGDEDGKTLYLTAHSSSYKLRVKTGKVGE